MGGGVLSSLQARWQPPWCTLLHPPTRATAIRSRDPGARPVIPDPCGADPDPSLGSFRFEQAPSWLRKPAPKMF
ncbi:hypothetical protein RRG08_052352 [Elysia crispata]|uniref:Uncharacterized protein n=1 Tax=Elysia crispata TaxID=231223 RepID=A0AAE1DT50_9GAST|nr:hypothetical protein RRG08_052352 [Elysia crispata]